MSDWRIFYSEGSYEGSVEDAPPRDVQVIVQSHPDVGWHLVVSADYYIWSGGQWVGVDIFGLFDYLIEPGWKRVLMGRTITNEEYMQVYQQAKDDRNFARKGGFLPGERQP